MRCFYHYVNKKSRRSGDRLGKRARGRKDYFADAVCDLGFCGPRLGRLLRLAGVGMITKSVSPLSIEKVKARLLNLELKP